MLQQLHSTSYATNHLSFLPHSSTEQNNHSNLIITIFYTIEHIIVTSIKRKLNLIFEKVEETHILHRKK